MKNISSRDNPTFKAIRSLIDDPREQRRQRQTLIDGIHLLNAYREQGRQPLQILVAESAEPHADIQALLTHYAAISQLSLRDSLFKELSGVATPTGIAALIEIPETIEQAFSTGGVVLDAVQDAGNVGSILRTAAAAGIRDVVLGNGCAGVWTPRVLRAAQGAHFSLNIREQVELDSFIAECTLPTVATVAHAGQSLYSIDLSHPVMWLLGNEGAGLSTSLIDVATYKATIPLVAGESLNVAAAAAVCLFEVVRQRHG